MKKLALVFFIIAFSNYAYAQCITPESGMEISESAVFCGGVFDAGNGISIASDGATLDCNNSALTGNSVGFGILIKNRNNVEVKNCNLENFDVGINVENSDNILLENNSIKNSRIGLGILNSANIEEKNNAFEGNVQDRAVLNNEGLDSISRNTSENSENNGNGINNAENKEKSTEKTNETRPAEKEIIVNVLRVRNPEMASSQIEAEAGKILAMLPEMPENFEITREFGYDSEKNETVVQLVISPKKSIGSLQVYDYIPKCFASSLNQINFKNDNFEVIEQDPLIVWNFFNIGMEQKLSYSSSGKIEEQCKELFGAFGAADEQKKSGINLSAFFGMALTAAIVAAFILFSAKGRRGTRRK